MLKIIGAVSLGFILGNQKAQEYINTNLTKTGSTAIEFLANLNVSQFDPTETDTTVNNVDKSVDNADKGDNYATDTDTEI